MVHSHGTDSEEEEVISGPSNCADERQLKAVKLSKSEEERLLFKEKRLSYVKTNAASRKFDRDFNCFYW